MILKKFYVQPVSVVKVKIIANIFLHLNYLDEHSLDDIGVSFFGDESFLQPRVQGVTILDKTITNLILPYLKCSLADARHNACVLLSKMFQEITDIRKDIYNNLVTALLDRMIDRNYSIRALAADALRRFQEPENASDPVSQAYIFHLKQDPSYQVRLSVLSCIEPSRHSLNEIIRKTRDVKAIVRKTAYIKLAETVSVKSLNIDQRLALLKDGLNDRNEYVRKVVESRLLPVWLKAFDDDIIQFLIALDIQSDPETFLKAMQVIFAQYLNQNDNKYGTKLHHFVNDFKEKHFDEKKIITKDHLSVEKTFLWRTLNCFIIENDTQFVNKAKIIYSTETQARPEGTEAHMIVDDNVEEQQNDTTIIHHINSNQPEALLEILLPEFPHFCHFFEKFAVSIDLGDFSEEVLIDLEFIYDQLVKILLVYDVGDEVQESSLLSFVKSIIFSSSLYLKFEDPITPVIHFLATKVYTDSFDLLDFIAESTNQVYNSAAEAQAEEMSKNVTPIIDSNLMKQYEIEYAKLTVDIEEQKDLFDQALSKQDYNKAHELKLKLDELNEEREKIMQKRLDPTSIKSSSAPLPSQSQPSQSTQAFDLNKCPSTLLKCLQIFTACLEFGKFNTTNDIILSHIERIVSNRFTLFKS